MNEGMDSWMLFTTEENRKMVRKYTALQAGDLPSRKNLVAPPWKSSPGLLRLMSRVWEEVYLCLTLWGCFTITLSAWSWRGKLKTK